MNLDRKSISETWVYVDDFGAKGDGITDDTAAFERAIAHAVAAFGWGVIKLGPKLYVLDGLTITNNWVRIEGVSEETSSLYLKPSSVNGFIVKINANFSSVSRVYVNGQVGSNPSGNGLVIGANVNGAYIEEVHCQYVGGAAISLESQTVDCYLKNCYSLENGDGFRVIRPLNLRMSNCSTNLNTIHGLHIQGADGLHLDGYVSQADQVGVRLTTYVPGGPFVSKNCNFNGCNVKNSVSDGVIIDAAQDIAFFGLHARTCGGKGISIINGGARIYISGSSSSGNTGIAITEDNGTYTDCSYELYLEGSIGGKLLMATSQSLIYDTSISPPIKYDGDISNWTARFSDNSSNGWTSVCWSPELGLFVAVSQDVTNTVQTSPDGITWTTQAAQAGFWQSVCWSPELGLFVAVSVAINFVMTSPDGITWTIQTAAENNGWRAIVWSPELGLFCAVATSGTSQVMTSPDGITWTGRTAASAVQWYAISWSPDLGLFAAAGAGGANLIMTSPDGITWTSRTPEPIEYFSICWSPEVALFVALGTTGTNRVATSRDGITWVNANTAAENNAWVGITWSPELRLFCAVSNDGTNRIMTSPDAVVWTSRTAPENNGWTAIVWSPELRLFCAVSGNGHHRVMTCKVGQLEFKDGSTILDFENGGTGTASAASARYALGAAKKSPPSFSIETVSTWVARAASEANTFTKICWSPELGLFAAVSLDGTNRVMTSPNGITWTARSAAEANSWISITWSPELGLFAAVSYNGTNRVMTSPDGIVWTAHAAAEANNWNDICWSPELGLFAAVAQNGTNRVMTSSDGIVWTAQAAAAANAWVGICWSPELGLFCAVSTDGTFQVMTSPDGLTWTARTASEANQWLNVCWSPELGLFAAVSFDGTNRVMTSPNGIVWTAHAAAEANSWQSIVWSPELGLFCAIATDGTNKIMTSPNGTTWTGRVAAEENQWISICWSPELGLFASVSLDGTNRAMTSYIRSNIGQRLTVGQSGADFTSIQSAINSILDNSSGKQYVIEIYPGHYNEQIVMKDYCHLVGNSNAASRGAVRVYYTNNVIKTANECTISDIIFEAVVGGPSAINVVWSDSSCMGATNVCEFRECMFRITDANYGTQDIALVEHNSTSGALLRFTNCKFRLHNSSSQNTNYLRCIWNRSGRVRSEYCAISTFLFSYTGTCTNPEIWRKDLTGDDMVYYMYGEGVTQNCKFLSNTGTGRIAFGYVNDFDFIANANLYVNTGAGSIVTFEHTTELNLDGKTTADLSFAEKARIYYDSVQNKVLISASGAAYTDFSGFSGTSGVSGFSGYSGLSGASGFSGVSGFSGTFSGESGFSGASGVSGFSGTSGFSGVSGFSASAGSNNNGIYSDGFDGALSFSVGGATQAGATRVGTTYTMQRDIYASSIEIADTITVVPNGFRIFCSGTCTFIGTGHFNLSGSDGLAGGGTGAATGTGTLGGGNGGGAGGTGTGTAGSTNTACVGTNGGAGGAGSGGAGGAGGTTVPPNAAFGGTQIIRSFINAISGNFLGGNSTTKWMPGGGGGGGGGDGTAGGGGGGGGGSIVIVCKNFAASATSGEQIKANGGNGGSPAAGNRGGGGGGAGGIIILVTSTTLPSGVTTSVTGGVGGTKTGTGVNGTNGSNGIVVTFIN